LQKLSDIPIVTPMGKILLILIAVPLVETWFLIEVGSAIGAPLTILSVIATAVIGGHLVRKQGLDTLRRVQQSQAQNEIPALALAEGVAIIFAGALLITPGFFTDGIGFLCLWPQFRREFIAKAIAASLLKSVQIHGMRGQAAPQPGYYRAGSEGTAIDKQRPVPNSDNDGVTIEGEFRSTDNDPK
jgi:UPF0716 protein FxsA